MGSYRELIVWQKSMDLVKEVYAITNSFPKEELYGLTSQIRRSAISIPSNIAEGQARGRSREFSRFLEIAHGSLAELDTQIQLSVLLQYVRTDQIRSIEILIIEIGKMLRTMIRKYRNEVSASNGGIKQSVSVSTLQTPNS